MAEIRVMDSAVPTLVPPRVRRYICPAPPPDWEGVSKDTAAFAHSALMLRDRDVQLLLDLEEELDEVEGIGAQVLPEPGLGTEITGRLPEEAADDLPRPLLDVRQSRHGTPPW